MANLDPGTVAGFGDEWSRFDQSRLSAEEHQKLFELYFDIFPWRDLPQEAVGFDLGCGSGRWAKLVAPRVGFVHLIDASNAALAVARRNLAGVPNCEFHHASVDQIPLPDRSMDFGYSLGVLHHVPDTAAGVESCVRKLKPGAPFLIYLYYALDNRPRWFRLIWRLSDALRVLISRLPHGLRFAVSQVVALCVYWPLARTAWMLEKAGLAVDSLPLSLYRNKSLYTMRTDSLDRFGTQLERRFTRAEIEVLLRNAGLDTITFREEAPYWVALGLRTQP